MPDTGNLIQGEREKKGEGVEWQFFLIVISTSDKNVWYMYKVFLWIFHVLSFSMNFFRYGSWEELLWQITDCYSRHEEGCYEVYSVRPHCNWEAEEK